MSSQAVRYISDGLAGGQLEPVVDRVFPFAEIAAAHRYLEKNEQLGKIVATI